MKPADAEHTQTGKVKIHSTSKTLFDPTAVTNTTFYVDSLLAAYRRTIGLVNKDSTMKELPNEVTNLIAVSDGSVKEGEGSAGYVISDVSDNKN